MSAETTTATTPLQWVKGCCWHLTHDSLAIVGGANRDCGIGWGLDEGFMPREITDYRDIPGGPESRRAGREAAIRALVVEQVITEEEAAAIVDPADLDPDADFPLDDDCDGQEASR